MKASESRLRKVKRSRKMGGWRKDIGCSELSGLANMYRRSGTGSTAGDGM